ncbi:MAG: chemotaxis protein CheW [Alphaproteobacteria bacterium]|nr:MAG: chemotaxis protein CheW [Alphaproteobacteria bacterium]
MENKNKDFVTIRLANQLCGIPILDVHDVLSEQSITAVPLAPPAVSGVLNLRGRIVTAINLRKRLGLPEQEAGGENMSIVVEYQGEPYSLLIDSVGDVLSFPEDSFENNPVTLDSCWQEVSNGIFRLKGELLVILDVEKLLNFETGQSAAA